MLTALLANTDAAIVRRYHDGAAALVRDSRKGWRSGRLDTVLAGNFDLIAILKSV
jgi:ATP-dependent Clp protease ATP-binding subunit ClpC